MQVGEHAALGEREDLQELRKLLVVTDGERDGARRDALLLLLSRDLARELEELRREGLWTMSAGHLLMRSLVALDMTLGVDCLGV